MKIRSSIRSLLLVMGALLCFAAPAFAQIGISVSFGPPALPVYEQPVCPGTATSGRRDIGPMRMTPGITGFPEPGLKRRKWATSGRPGIGAGAAAHSFSMKDIGARP